jgi:type I restriction enzyme S subunit
MEAVASDKDIKTPGTEPLPPGWRRVRFRDVCIKQTGTKDPRKTPEEEFIYIDISSVDNQKKHIVKPQRLKGCDAPSRARQIIQTNDVLVSTTRPNLNAVAIVPPELDNQICSTGFCVLRPMNTQLSPEFLFLFVQSKLFVESLSILVKGALYPAVTDNQVRSQLLPLPPLPEQKRIAAILKEQMAAVEKALKATEQQLETAKALPAAYLRSVFNSPEAKGWRLMKLGEVCVQDRQIIEPSSGVALKLPYLSLEHVKSCSGKILKQPSGVIEDEGLSTTFAFDERHLLYGKLRPYLNKVAMPDFPGRCTTELIPLLPNSGIQRGYLCWILRRQETVNEAMRGKTGSRMPRANMEDLFQLLIPIPPLPEQKRITTTLNEQIASAEKLSKQIEQQLYTINKLPAALLKRAFNGEL